MRPMILKQYYIFSEFWTRHHWDSTTGTSLTQITLHSSYCYKSSACFAGCRTTVYSTGWLMRGTGHPQPFAGIIACTEIAQVIPQVKSLLNGNPSNNINVQSCTKLCTCVISSNMSTNIAWLGGREIFLVQLQKCLGQQDILCGSRLLSTWKMHDGVLGRIGYILLLWITVWMSQAIFCHVWSLRCWRMVISVWMVH